MEAEHERQRGDGRAMREPAAPVIGSGAWIGNHEKGEQQQGSAHQMMHRDGEALAEPERPREHRAAKEQDETRTGIAARGARHDHRARHRDPSGQREAVAPLPRRYPCSRKRDQREDHAKTRRIEQMFAA